DPAAQCSGSRLMPEPLLDVQNVAKHFGGFQALAGVSIQVKPAERFGLIGPNGSGKTTLINCISGTLRNEGGRILFQGVDITAFPAHRRARLGIARSFQIPRPFGSMTVVENLRIALEYAAHTRWHGGDVMAEAMRILALVGLDVKARVIASRLTQIEMRK